MNTDSRRDLDRHDGRNRIPSSISWIVARQIPMAGSAAAIVFAATRYLGGAVSPWWYVAAFFGTWCVYLRDSAASCRAEDAISQPRRAAVFRDSVRWCRTAPFVSAIVAFVAIALARPSPTTWAVIATIGTLGLLHGLQNSPARSSGRERPLAWMAVVKSPIVAAAWTLGAVALPILETESSTTPPTIAVILVAVLLYLALLCDSLLLDLRDRIADRTFGLNTIAVRIGPRGIHAMVGLLVALMVLTSLVGIAGLDHAVSWRRISIACTLGIAVPWILWRRLEKDETTVTLSMMSWRYIAAASVAGSASIVVQ